MHHQSHAPRRWSRILLGALVLALLPLSVQLSVPRLANPASASGDLLCVGFSDCAGKGYSDGGYHQHWGHMYWRMYSGRNCVNYVAYRMVASGLPDSRPWSGSGNATNWGYAMSSIRNTKPVVGAVAWWKANAPGAGSLGHVAYVERVVSPTEIIVSESNWGSDFDWRRITTSGNWPTGFIHFNDKGVVNTKAPVLAGDPQVGSQLSVTPGAWTPSASVNYQWMIDGKAVAGQTAATYKPGPATLGRVVSVKVTASAKNYAAATVTRSAPVATAAGQIQIRTAPSVSGTAIVDDPLTLAGGAYTPAIGATRRSVQWYADGQPIDGATDLTFVPTRDQVGQQITASITVGHAGYDDLTLTTDPTGPILAPLIKQDESDRGSVTGTPTRGGTVTASPGSFVDPETDARLDDAAVSYQWYRGDVAHPKRYQAIPGATDATYHPTTDDVGQSLAVKVVASHKNYRDLSTVYRVPGVVTTASTVRVTAHGLQRAARIRVRVLSPGADPTGKVSVRVGMRTLTGTLVDGLAVLRFDPLATGTRRVVATYAGTSVILAGRAAGSVEVVAPPKKATKKPTKKAATKKAATKKATTKAAAKPAKSGTAKVTTKTK